ncbi:hypothetical protein NEMIN01_0280 [Nematocida minor]|uniref:uncharacterized protein n=1 Tax=Nematocida minor TaxID=1912983 RepID=UPI00221EF967|nr:uncharacterized protein NEMIN01_0280 [Nematocida minor]KAI5189114.1 hypothetical protein NEMIN01_0280 [Nematocida minor]
MVVGEYSWVTVNTEEKGPVKCISMKRDIAKTLSLGRKGTFPVSALLGARMGVTLHWENGEMREHSEAQPEGKHTARKFKKHSKTILLKTPTLPDLVAMYNGKGDMTVSHEVLSQVIFHAIGVKYVAVLDEYKSMFLAAVAVARGTENLSRIGGHTHNIHTLGALGFGLNISAFTKESIPRGAGSVLFVLAQKKKYEMKEVLEIVKGEPESKRVSIDFLLYHPVKEGILGVFNEMMQSRSFGLLDLRELFYREYQSRIGAIHPAMSKLGCSGFILSGSFFDNGR